MRSRCFRIGGDSVPALRRLLASRKKGVFLHANMHSKLKRLVGVTLIALGFLWIGCCGTLFFPIIGSTGSLSAIWPLALGSTIHSQPWFKAISYALDCVWFLLYVAYAVIGFGLWKLKNWARKSMIGITIFGAIAAFVVSLVLVRPIVFGMSVIGMAIVEFGWLGWYLMRPRVRYAFGAWNRYSSAGEGIEPPGWHGEGNWALACSLQRPLLFFL